MSTETPHYLGHRARLRNRLLQERSSLADYELLELLLGYALLRRDTKPLAKTMLERFGSFRNVIHADPQQLLEMPGVGEGIVVLLTLVRETMARYAETPIRNKEQLCTPQSVAKMVLPRLSGELKEELWLLTVDNSNQQLGWDRLSKGTPNFAPCSPRDVLERLFFYKATGFFLVHNHPSGRPLPSMQDQKLTEELTTLTERVGIRLLDHIIVGDGTCYSLRQKTFIKI